MQKTEPKMIRANGMDLCADTFGDPGAPPLVLIMGLGAQMIAWHDPFCAKLADKGFHVIRFDNRDVGLSTKLDAAGAPNIMAMMAKLAVGASITTPYALQDMATDTAGLLDAMNIPKAHIVGASMGGGTLERGTAAKGGCSVAQPAIESARTSGSNGRMFMRKPPA